jgi:hypothetical protein
MQDRDILKRLLKSDYLYRITHDTEEWLFVPGEEETVAVLEEAGLVETISADSSWLKAKLWKVVTPGVRTGKYEALFSSFWESYLKERRIGKAETYKEWKKLSSEEKGILPICARNYSEYIRMESSAPYMKHPVRFIKTGLFRDYLSNEKEASYRDTTAVLNYFSDLFLKEVGYRFPWDQRTMITLQGDISAIGAESIKDKIWWFFSGEIQQVKKTADDLGFGYPVFHSLLQSTLSAVKNKPQKCKYCGGMNGKHLHWCPIQKDKKIKEEENIKEALIARESGFSIQKAFENKIKK